MGLKVGTAVIAPTWLFGRDRLLLGKHTTPPGSAAHGGRCMDLARNLAASLAS
eukprot:GSA120T00021445001.1